MTASAATSSSEIPQSSVPTGVAINLARKWSRRESRHRMQRAGRIFSGNATLRDRIAAYPDKGWLLMILAGASLIAYALGCATILVAESVLSAAVG